MAQHLTSDQRFEILKTELALIQATLDKYDDLIFRNRNFFITLWLACVGLAFTIKSEYVPWLAVLLSLIYWILEGMMRYQYWYKYVDRYRFIRDSLNDKNLDLDSLSIYDLTNEKNRIAVGFFKKFKICFFKAEPLTTYGVMAASAVMIGMLVSLHIIQL